MAIVVFSFDYPPNDGGIARVSEMLARRFRLAHYDVRVVTQAPPGWATSYRGGTELRLASRRPVREFEALRSLRRNFSRDLLLSGVWYPEGLIASIAGSKRTAILAHGSELFSRGTGVVRIGTRYLQSAVLRSARLVIANSAYTAALVSNASPAAYVKAIPLGVDHEFFSPGDSSSAKRRFGFAGKTVICSVSRLHRYKGHDTVLKALSLLAPEDRSRLIYVIAGKGPARQQLEEFARSLKVSDVVRWLGYVADSDLVSLYRASDLFVLCTRANPEAQEVEGFGLVFLEAQACGTPVVGARAGGIPDAIAEGDGGWLIAPDDAAALAEIFSDLARNPDRFEAVGRRARARVEKKCSWEAYFNHFIAALEARGLLLPGDRLSEARNV